MSMNLNFTLFLSTANSLHMFTPCTHEFSLLHHSVKHGEWSPQVLYCAFSLRHVERS